MIVLKFSIIASRADDSQHTFVTVPVIRTVSNPCSRSSAVRSEDEGRKALNRNLRTISSSASTSRSGNTSWPGAPFSNEVTDQPTYSGLLIAKKFDHSDRLVSLTVFLIQNTLPP